MLDMMSHRGWAWRDVIEERGKTFGAIGLKIQEQAMLELKQRGIPQDSTSAGRFARQ